MALDYRTTCDQIRANLDIVELIGRVVRLRPAGENWKGLCPFHAEKTPSFNVNPRKGIFKCFGCGVGGDAFAFVMRQDKLTFPEAVRELARMAGVAMPEEGRGSTGGSGREELLRAMALAARLYAEALWKPGGERAREYLDRRGIDAELARRFGLGLAPEGWEFATQALRSEGLGEDVLVAAGLAAPRPSGSGIYDRFRGRLIFPICDLQGRVVAFGGRAFGDEQPKYLNSPETPIYSKGSLLYAMSAAREAMREKGRALLVEGYVDCLMAHQHGFTETVAALGTVVHGRPARPPPPLLRRGHHLLRRRRGRAEGGGARGGAAGADGGRRPVGDQPRGRVRPRRVVPGAGGAAGEPATTPTRSCARTGPRPSPSA